MSNIYIKEPPTKGKVLLVTTLGDIDIELWSKETPLACRNFVQLCLDGYYDNTIFHRVVKGFIAQGGDPTGTGAGGESIYDEPFKDEFHSRLRFNRRGLVAMANSGKNDNGSQFFFTLGPTPELQNVHTLFGKVTGDTLFNMLRIEECTVGQDDRPQYPHKILSTEVLSNPFPDIVPRITKVVSRKEEKKGEVKARAVKDFKLLSFGDEAEEEEETMEAILKTTKIKTKSAPGLMDVEEDMYKGTGDEIEPEPEPSEPEPEPEPADEPEEKEEVKHKKMETDKTESKMQKQMKKAKEALQGVKVTEDSQSTMYKKYMQEQEKYKELQRHVPKKGASREEYTMQLLAKFKDKMSSAKSKVTEGEEDVPKKTEKIKENVTEDDDDDEDWMVHELNCEESNAPPLIKLAKDANSKSDDWFDMVDPRSSINKRKREKNADDKKRSRK